MLADELEKVLFCPVERDKPLASLSTLGVGGRAECFVEPSDISDFQSIFSMSQERNFPVYVLGGGSNVILPDGRMTGVLLSTRGWKKIQWFPRDKEMLADLEAGFSLASLVNAAVQKGLGGLEFASGIPGTLGGALAGNVGAGGRSVSEFLSEVTTVESDGSLKRWHRGEFSYAYRSFSLSKSGRLFLSCKMVFHPAPKQEIEAALADFRSRRRIQPHGARSAGCCFKNPQGDSAGRLLDQCGCKGLSRGSAVVSQSHANFILNLGGATAADVTSLMQECQKRVYQATGILLEPEVRFLGAKEDFPFDEQQAGGSVELCV